MSKLIFILFFISTILLYLKTQESNNFRKNLLYKNQVIDSLNKEILDRTVEINSNNTTLEKMREIDSLCATMYDIIKNKEIEQ